VNYRHECKTFDCVVITVINLHEADPGLDPASQHNIGVGDVFNQPCVTSNQIETCKNYWLSADGMLRMMSESPINKTK